MNFKEYKGIDYSQVADEILQFWKENQIFERSVSLREGAPTFTFYEGPPSANGTPGIHHVMARTIKDIFCRFHTLRGKQVKRKGGWDTHGLPVELQVEKELGITKDDIGRKISVEEYNQKCRETVMRFTDQWNDLTERMGYWVDLQNPYVTYENNYIESCWWLLKQLYTKGLLYKGYTVQPYSPAAGTGLSSHELNMPGTYKDVKDTSVVAIFKAIRSDKSAFLFEAEGVVGDVCFLAWTTTPWTLPANCGLTVGEKIDYVQIRTFNPYTYEPVTLIMAKALVSKYFGEKGQEASFDDYKGGDKVIPWRILQEMKGRALLEIRYEQLIPAVTNHELETNAFRVIAGDFVTTEDGTGIVHTASVFGADDFRVCQQNGVPSVMVKDENGKDVPVVDRKGKFVREVGSYLVQKVAEHGIKTHRALGEDDFYVKNYLSEDEKQPDYKTTDEIIAIMLKVENKAFRVERYEHPYPHCWRTDKPVLYYPLDSWFIRTTAVKDKLIGLNNTINWQPASTGTGRFGNWLENLVDWNLSRSRFWGTPLPIWRVEKFRKVSLNQPDEKCIGSVSELSEEGWYYFGGEKFEAFKTEALDKYKSAYEKGEKSPELDAFMTKFSLEGRFKPFEELVKSDFTPSGIQSLMDKVNGFNLEALIEYLTPAKEIVTELDLHRPYIDRIAYIFTEEQEDNYFLNVGSFTYRHSLYVRETDLIDVWFDSGAMPYAQWHYPFENQDIFEQSFPADFISEGVDQTRGWFFTLHAISTMVSESVSFKNVVSTGLVLDKNGDKMSKRKGNVINPFEALPQYGIDPIRWYMITNAEPWDNLRFNLDGITEVQRKFFGTLFNTYNFFALYANLDGYQLKEFDRVPYNQLPELDRWILSKLNSLIAEVTEQFEDYNPTKAGRAIQDFVCDQLSNWYVRLSRRRFWMGEMTQDKQAAYQTLQHCLVAVTQLMSPIAPFFADWLYKNMTDHVRTLAEAKQTPLRHPSVHLSDWQAVEVDWIDQDLETAMQLAQDICSLVHSLRKGHKIKVRQPLSKVLIPVLSAETRRQIEQVSPIIMAEVNVKSVEFLDDDSGILKKKTKPNFKALGPKFGPQMKDVAAKIVAMTADDIKALETNGSLTIGEIEIQLTDVEILTEDIPGWLVATDYGITVALDVTITDELRQEGIARDVVNRIQNLRKDSGLEVTDKIRIHILRNNDTLAEAILANEAYICTETQALSLQLADQVADATEIEMDEYQLLVNIEVAKA